jgi:ferredoxin
MEGNGPRHGDLKPVGVIMASGDGVALDAVASRVIGFEPMEIHTTRAATNRGLGNGDLNRIKVMGEKISDVETTFKKPSSWQRNIPPRIMSFISRLIYIRLQANIEKCIQCGICEKNCPVGAMHLTPYPTVDTEKCIQCYCCHELCPEGAIIMNRSWLARRIG